MATAPTILLVDDTPAIRRSMRSCIERETNWKICGEAGKLAVEMVRELHPDVVLLDLSMPIRNGLEAARQIGTIAPHVCILMFTLHAYPELVQDAHSVGVKDVIAKSEGSSKVLQAIRSLFPA